MNLKSLKLGQSVVSMNDDEWEKLKSKSKATDKKRLTPEAKKLVERYKFLNSEMDRYCGSIFYKGENDPREKKMLDEQKQISERMKQLGYNLDLYY